MKRTDKLLFSADDEAAIRNLVPPSGISRQGTLYRKIALILLVKILLLSAAWVGFAAGNDHANVWRGQTDRDQVAITLTLASSDDARLAFGAPRFCTLTARLESVDDYSLRNSNGGYCDRLLGGRLRLTVHADTRKLTVRLTDEKGAERDTAELAAADRADPSSSK